MGKREAVGGSRLPAIVVGVMAAAAFGPYTPFLVGGVRTEQFAVYALAFVLFPFLLFRAKPYLSVLLPWMLLIIVAVTAGIPPTAHGLVYASGSLVSSADNLVLPLAVMLLVWAVVPPAKAIKALVLFATITIWASVTNALISIVGTRMDLSPFLRVFWSGSDGETTAERAAQLGRFSGIFNQPAEAGVIYGLAGLLAIWRYRHKPRLMLAILGIISVGGLLSVSKIFIFGGLPLILLYLWLSRSGTGRIGLVFSTGLVVLGVAQSGLFQQWIGFNYLARLFAPVQNQSTIEFYSAGRWNEDAETLETFSAVLRTRPLTGFGISGLDVPYDSAWTEAIVLAGIFGLFLLGIVFVALFRMALRIGNADLRLLGLLTVAFLIGSSLGLPDLTANRVATVVWLLLGILCLVSKSATRKPAPRGAEPGARGVTRADAVKVPVTIPR